MDELKYKWTKLLSFSEKIKLASAVFALLMVIFLMGYTLADGISVSSAEEEMTELEEIRAEQQRLREDVDQLKAENEKLREENKELRGMLADVNVLSDDIVKLKETVLGYMEEKEKEDQTNNEEINKEEYPIEDFDYAINPNEYSDIYFGNSLSVEEVELIKKYSKYDNDGEYTVDPHLVVGLLFRESSFRARARNGDCYGLGQVMSSTGQYMSDVWNLNEHVTPEKLYDRKTNIKYAVLYLNYLYDKYDGDYNQILSHYSGSRSIHTLRRYMSKIDQFMIDMRDVEVVDVIDISL